MSLNTAKQDQTSNSFDVVGCHVEADSYGDEDEADDEEGGQHGPRGQDGLPGR